MNKLLYSSRPLIDMLFKKLRTNYSKSKESKTLISNFISLSLLQVAGYIFPLLTVPYLAHVIGADLYGEIAFAMSIMVFFQTLVDYGFVFSAVRDIARCRDDLKQVSQIYTNVMWSRALLALLSLSLLVSLIVIVPKFYEIRWVLLASFLIVIGHAIFPDWMFQAVEKMKFITLFNICVKFIFTIAVFLFIHEPEDYLLQPIFTSLGYLLSGAGAMYLIHRWGIRLGRPQLRNILNSIRTNFDLFVNQIVPNLYNSTSVLLLGFFHGNTANGIFEVANRFNTAGASFFSIISRTFYPFLARKINHHQFFVRLNIACASAVALILFIGAPLIIHTFFSSEFDGAINVLRIIAISLIFLAISNAYGTNYLIIRGFEHEMRQINLYSSILGLVIAIPAVICLSYLGVAITILFARAIIGILVMLKAHKIQSSEWTPAK